MAVDGNGEVIVTGTFAGSLAFPPSVTFSELLLNGTYVGEGGLPHRSQDDLGNLVEVFNTSNIGTRLYPTNDLIQPWRGDESTTRLPQESHRVIGCRAGLTG